MILKLILLIPLFVCFCSTKCQAQYSKNTKDAVVLGQISNHLKKLDSLLFYKETIPIPMNQHQELNIDSIFNSSMNYLVNMQKSLFDAKTGVSIKLSYNHQTGVNPTYYSDEDNDYPFRNRVQASLDWDILESSIVGRKIAHEIFEIENLQHSYKFQQEQQGVVKDKKFLTSEDRWDLIISFICLQRVNLLNEMLRLREHLYDSHRVLYSDIAHMQIEILKAKSLMVKKDVSIISESMQLIDLDKYKTNLLLDTLGLFNIYLDNNLDLKQYELEQKLLHLNKQLSSYVRQMDINVFVKAQYHGKVIGSSDKGKMDFGISAKFPLTLEHRKRRSAIDSEISINKREQIYAKEGLIAMYNKQIEGLTHINSKLIAGIETLKPIKKNILNHKEMYQNNVLSLEEVILQYDAYLMLLANIYSTIKEREMLIESIIN